MFVKTTESEARMMKEELLKMMEESLSSEDVQQIVRERFSNAVESAIDNAFQYCSEPRQALEKKIDEVLVPYIENYDFSKYLPKLDTVLTEIVNSENCMADKKILENFKMLTTAPDEKEMNVSDIFNAWIKYCEEEIDTDGLDVCYYDGVSYESVGCTMSVEYEDKPIWSNHTYGTVTFENEHDESLNIQFRISKWDVKEEFSIDSNNNINIQSLRYLDDFQLLIIRLARADTKIIIDKEYDDNEIYPKKEPEASFS